MDNTKPAPNGSTRPVKHTMLDNIEFFHYAEKFSGQTVVLCSESFRDIGDLIFDFFLLRQTKIGLVIVGTEADEPFIRELDAWNHLGLEFGVFECGAGEPLPNRNIIPAYIVKNRPDRPLNLLEQAHAAALNAGAKKLYVVGDKPKHLLSQNGRPVAEIDHEGLKKLIRSGDNLNFSENELEFFGKVVGEGNMDCVLIGKEEGGMFTEMFTHLGHGTLISKSYQRKVRRGKPEDVLQILFMTKYYESQNVILPIGKDYLLRNIADSYVYEVDQVVVAFAMLCDHGPHAELSKFCTHPRYQGKGKARELALRLIEVAREQKRRSVFALSIIPAMWDFFRGLGFAEIDRRELPEQWKKKYDFNRPSKAFIKHLD